MEVFLLSLVLKLNVASHDDRYVSFTYLDYVIEALRYKLTIYDVGSTHSETSVCPNETARRYEGCHLHTHRRESLSLTNWQLGFRVAVRTLPVRRISHVLN
jgi:hypothetical protein